ncbi:putative late blight resistance protein-like protein R1A-4 [Forsythia ovata]|uniref:Late blight resistance protein-like protein R1A-4 n=1 Tax=Forsythia ovata TaxID=205694 RepID=A0ABD1TR59_9LAMI
MKHRFHASIAKLCNLETLIINPGKFRSIFNTSFLPPEIWKMSRLRHLLFLISYLPYPTNALKRGTFVPLENLQTLSNVVNFRWTKEVLEMMPNLKKLVISYEHDGRTEWSSYCFDNFVHLHQLEVLKCIFFAKCYIKYQDPLPLNFAFPQKRKRYCYNLVEIPPGIGKIPTLEIELCECATSLVTSAQVLRGKHWRYGHYGFQSIPWRIPCRGSLVHMAYVVNEHVDGARL